MTADAPLIVGISGIRGIVGASLTAEIVGRFAAAFGTWMAAGSTVLMARDTRPSGGAFAQVCAAALQQTGCNVVDLGVCATPTTKLLVGTLAASGALIVTASHNPAPWNGMKMVRGDGVFLNAAEGSLVAQIFESGDFRKGTSAASRALSTPECNEPHLERILARVDIDRIRGAELNVAIDYCNGVGSLLIPELMRELGVRCHSINAEPNGQFSRDPEPLPENMQQLCAAVRERGAVAGFAVDPDGDRVALVDEGGHAVGEDYTLALAVSVVAKRRRGAVVTTLSTSQAVTDVAVSHGCEVLLTPVGEVHVAEKMLQVQALVGGEGNGGVILTDVVPGRDAALGVALTLEALSSGGTGLSALIAQLPRYHLSKRKLACSAAAMDRAVAWLQGRYRNASVDPVKDGAKLYLEGTQTCPWIHLRPSNTEPVMRICAESGTVAEANALCDEVEDFLSKAT